MQPNRPATNLLGEPTVFVEVNHLLFRCAWDWSVRGWRCGRCEVGQFVAKAGEGVPRPGRACPTCYAEICLPKAESDVRWYGVAAAILVGTWPALLWLTLMR